MMKMLLWSSDLTEISHQCQKNPNIFKITLAQGNLSVTHYLCCLHRFRCLRSLASVMWLRLTFSSKGLREFIHQLIVPQTCSLAVPHLVRMDQAFQEF